MSRDNLTLHNLQKNGAANTINK